MEIKSKFDHFNINVTNLERSIAFYEKALGLKEHHRKEASDGSFTLVYLTDNETGFLLELTWLKDHTAPYELGENESHLCFRVAGDYDAIRAYHKEMNCVCFENTVNTRCLRYTVSGQAKALSIPPGEYAGNGETQRN